MLAGDVSHDLGAIEEVFSLLRRRFAHVFFVPGNHDLWVIGDTPDDSMGKFTRLLDLCRTLDVLTTPARVGDEQGVVWILPLLSWYLKPEESDDSLFVTKRGEDFSLDRWADNRMIKWPPLPDRKSVADYFLGRNERHLRRVDDVPVITFSHFMSRSDLMFGTDEENARNGGPVRDSHKPFNFSRVAGTKKLDAQIRKVGSVAHVYGHQHRNRHRIIDGVRYVSHCLGYPHERQAGQIRHLTDSPRQVWDTSRSQGDPVITAERGQ